MSFFQRECCLCLRNGPIRRTVANNTQSIHFYFGDTQLLLECNSEERCLELCEALAKTTGSLNLTISSSFVRLNRYELVLSDTL